MVPLAPRFSLGVVMTSLKLKLHANRAIVLKIPAEHATSFNYMELVGKKSLLTSKMMRQYTDGGITTRQIFLSGD
jgi:hypothetical protein